MAHKLKEMYLAESKLWQLFLAPLTGVRTLAKKKCSPVPRCKSPARIFEMNTQTVERNHILGQARTKKSRHEVNSQPELTVQRQLAR